MVWPKKTRVYPIAGLEHWTGLLDWTTGLMYACAVPKIYTCIVRLIIALLCVLAGSCQIEVLGSNKQVGLAREARVNMAKVNL